MDCLSAPDPSAYTSRYVLDDQDWVGPSGRPIIPGIVHYAMADGSFAVLDPARNYWKKCGNREVQERVSGYVFSPLDICDGLVNTIPGNGRLCNGLIDDLASWQRESGQPFTLLKQFLQRLAPSDHDA